MLFKIKLCFKISKIAEWVVPSTGTILRRQQIGRLLPTIQCHTSIRLLTILNPARCIHPIGHPKLRQQRCSQLLQPRWDINSSSLRREICPSGCRQRGRLNHQVGLVFSLSSSVIGSYQQVIESLPFRFASRDYRLFSSDRSALLELTSEGPSSLFTLGLAQLAEEKRSFRSSVVALVERICALAHSNGYSLDSNQSHPSCLVQTPFLTCFPLSFLSLINDTICILTTLGTKRDEWRQMQ